MSDEIPVVYSFWHGPTLSLWAKACLGSFVGNGHKVVLYTYDSSMDLPTGVSSAPASDILPEREVFYYKKGLGRGSVAAFANQFRYAMLYEHGGYWVDTDVWCEKRFPAFPVATLGLEAEGRLNNAVMFAPARDPFMKECLERSRHMGEHVRWGEAGPNLVTEIAFSRHFNVNILEQETFYPIHWKNAVRTILLPEQAENARRLCSSSYGVHLYNEMFRRARIDTSKWPPNKSFLGKKMQEATGHPGDTGTLSPLYVRAKDLRYRSSQRLTRLRRKVRTRLRRRR